MDETTDTAIALLSQTPHAAKDDRLGIMSQFRNYVILKFQIIHKLLFFFIF